MKALDMNPFNWKEDYLKIKKPIFLIFGDSDVVSLSHAMEMFQVKGGGVMGDITPMPEIRMAVIPYTTHSGLLKKLDWILPMIDDFLVH